MTTPIDLYNGGTAKDLYDTSTDLVLFLTALTQELKYPEQALLSQGLLAQVQKILDAGIAGEDNVKAPLRRTAAIIEQYDDEIEKYLEDPSSAADYVGVEEGKTLEGLASVYRQLKNFIRNVESDPLEFVKDFLGEKFETAEMPKAINPLPRRAVEYMLLGLKDIRDAKKMGIYLVSCMMMLGGAGPAEKYFLERRGEVPVPKDMDDPIRHLLDGNSPESYRKKYGDMIAVPGIQETLAVLVRAIDCTPEANVFPDPTFQNTLLRPDSYIPGLVAMRSFSYVTQGIQNTIDDVNARREIWDVVRTAMWPTMELMGFAQAPFFLTGETMEAPGLTDLVGEALPVPDPAVVPTPAKGDEPTLRPQPTPSVPGTTPVAPAASRLAEDFDDDEAFFPEAGRTGFEPIVAGASWLLSLPRRLVRYLGLSRSTTDTAAKAAIILAIAAVAAFYYESWTMPFEIVGIAANAQLQMRFWTETVNVPTFKVFELWFIIAHVLLLYVDVLIAFFTHAMWARGDDIERRNRIMSQTQEQRLQEARAVARAADDIYSRRTHTTPGVAGQLGDTFQGVFTNSVVAGTLRTGTTASLKSVGLRVKDKETISAGLMRNTIELATPRAVSWLARKVFDITPAKKVLLGVVASGGTATAGSLLFNYGRYVVQDVLDEYISGGLAVLLVGGLAGEVVRRIYTESTSDSTRGKGWLQCNIALSTMIRVMNLVFVHWYARQEFTGFAESGGAKQIASEAYVGYADWFSYAAGAQVGLMAFNMLNAAGATFISTSVRDNPDPVDPEDPSAVLERLEEQRNQVVDIANTIFDDEGNLREGVTERGVRQAATEARTVLLLMQNLADESQDAADRLGGSSSNDRLRNELLRQASREVRRIDTATQTAAVIIAQGSTIDDSGKNPFELVANSIAEAERILANAAQKDKAEILETIKGMKRTQTRMRDATSSLVIRLLAKQVQRSLQDIQRLSQQDNP